MNPPTRLKGGARQERRVPPFHIERARKRALENRMVVGLAGQQNAGKSTVFNMLTGSNQHVANYPGVTVDKKSGVYREDGLKVEIVDLPGTYSLTSFSLEERVGRDFLLSAAPDAVINVVDATQLKRSLYLTFQILEMGFPVVVALNMMDVAAARGLKINLERLSHSLGVDVVPTIGRQGRGREALRDRLREVRKRSGPAAGLMIQYERLEPFIERVEARLETLPDLAARYPIRWLAVKLLEGDNEAEKLIMREANGGAELLADVRGWRREFEAMEGMIPSDVIVLSRDRLAAEIVALCVSDTSTGRTPWSERIDRVVLNRVAAPFFLLAAIYLVYEISIVEGNELTLLTWPVLVWIRNGIASLLPSPALLFDPYTRLLGLWVVDSASALLNYIPIFFILFALIAVLEESGYMARIAFILDRVFHGFGLHGQSTLPFILSGVMAGGCAVPGVMATRAIPDRRSRLGTILTAPFMNCQAKLPLYILLINIFFADHRSWALFFIATVSILLALLVARLLTSTVLRTMETAPFVMELPSYHVPTLKGVLARAGDRTWVYIKKVATIVAAAAVVIFALLQAPGLNAERKLWYEGELDKVRVGFETAIQGTAYESLADGKPLISLLRAFANYEEAVAEAEGPKALEAVQAKFKARYENYYPLLDPGTDEQAAGMRAALKALADRRDELRRDIDEETLTYSFFGRFGRAIVPVTRFAGFDWKTNVALLSSFTARENSVATLGVLYQEGADENQRLEERMRNESRARGITPLHALAVILFFALYPPCLATVIMIKAETASWRWTLFSIVFPIVLGLAVSSLVFSVGRAFSLSGFKMMGIFYLTTLVLALVVGRGGGRRSAPPEEQLTDLSPQSI